MDARAAAIMSELLERVVPGSVLRDGLERILSARMGALIVIGDDAHVLELCTGGFHIDAEISPPRLSELAKMDGAMVLNRAGTRIAWANVQLMPHAGVPTSETGTRHRTAERVARSLSVPVIAVSEEMGTITLYAGETRRQLESTESIVNRVSHLLQVLSRHRASLDEASSALAHGEAHGIATLGEVALVVQRAEVVRRIGAEIAPLVALLGAEGRLAHAELDELISAAGRADVLVGRATSADDLAPVKTAIGDLGTGELASLEHIVALLGGPAASISDPLRLGVRLEPPAAPAEGAAAAR